MRILLLLLIRHIEGEDAGTWSGCDGIEYSMMMLRAQTYYRSGFFEYTDSERASSILSQRDVLKEKCPVAVLQAILFKLEENLVYQPDAFESLMSHYTLYLHEALRHESISAEDMRSWPLDQGIHRAQNISKALSQKRSLSSAMVMNYCQVEDRFGTAHELEWLLKPPFGEVVGEDAGLLKSTDLYIYQVDWPWCKPLRQEVLHEVRRAVHSVKIINYRGGPRREEQSAYFKFMIDHWETLPDFTIFVHPDADEHQGAGFLALKRALKLIRTQSQFAYDSLAYFPLAQQMVVDPMRTWGVDFAAKWRRFWRRLSGEDWERLGYVAPRCTWERHLGHYLAGLADESGRQSLQEAKATCESLEVCVGITCRTPLEPWELETQSFEGFVRNSCTARRGALEVSPEPREVSYVKNCSRPYAAPAEPQMKATYQRMENVFLLGYAQGDETVQGEAEARQRCDDLGKACNGFTCEASIAVEATTTKKGYAELQAAQSCTLRAGQEPYESPHGELTFLKLWPTEGEAFARRPAKEEAANVFQFYTGSQSIVRKDRMQWWPLEELKDFAADPVWCSDTTGVVEAVWHRLFGEPLAQHPREHDPELPLFLKWDTPTYFSFGDEKVI